MRQSALLGKGGTGVSEMRSVLFWADCGPGKRRERVGVSGRGEGRQRASHDNGVNMET